MKLLALDTSTDILSLAVARDGEVLAHTAAGGAQASATLLPAILTLMARAGLTLAELDAIVFGRGPGSFTGVRTACAVAQGLGFGAGVPLLPVNTLWAVDEEAREHTGARQIHAVLDARMDQVYSGRYDFDSELSIIDGGSSLISPEFLELEPGWLLAGNALDAYGARLPQGRRFACRPTATALVRLAPGLLASGAAVPPEQALPLYIRDKVAKTTLERQADAASRSA